MNQNLKKQYLGLGIVVILCSIFFFFFLNTQSVFAVECSVVDTHSCSVVTGLQECTFSVTSCPYGCELDVSYPADACVNGGDTCDSFKCILPPVYGCTDSGASNYNPLATVDDGSCVYSDPPTAPSITGNDWAIVDLSSTFDFLSTDPANYDIRYGVDWSDPADTVVDEWVPSSGYVNSGTSQSASHIWTSVGYVSFKVLAQNEWGENSDWTKKELFVNNADYSLVACSSNVNIGGIVTVTFDNIFNAEPLDWIGLYLLSDADGSAINWAYDSGSPDCTQTPGSAKTSGTCIFTMPAVPGEYNFRIFSDGGWTKLTTSNTVIVTDPSAGTIDVTVNVLQSTGGSIKSTDTVIDTKVCGPNCTKSYPSGSLIELQAVPSSSYWSFNGWSGEICFGTGLCNFSVTSNTSVSASFTPRKFIYNEL